jgi:putative phosphoribosyl transferase
MQFKNRTHAGKLLAQKLSKLTLDKKNTVVIALPRGGVPVAHEIAKHLQLPLDILLVKKLGAPSYPELAIGAVSENNEEVYNYELLAELGYKHSEIDPIKERALIKLQEIALKLRGENSPLVLTRKDVILVDDGIASGATIESVILILKKRNVRKIIIAVPVASADVVLRIQNNVDKLVILYAPDPIYTIGEWYENYIQIDTEEAVKILARYFSSKNKTFSNTGERAHPSLKG